MENKNINFVLEEKDFEKNSGVSKETIENMFNSFKNYLKLLDTQNLAKLDNSGKEWNSITLKKAYNRKLKMSKDVLNGGIATINEKGEMSVLNSTEQIIMRLVSEVNILTLINKKIKELEN